MKEQVLDFIASHELSDESIRIHSTNVYLKNPIDYFDEFGVFDMNELINLPTILVNNFYYDEKTGKLNLFISKFEINTLVKGNLRRSYITDALNGYPKNVKDVLIGFSSWSEIEKLIEEYPFLQAVELTKKDGQSYWQNHGERYSEFSASEQISYYNDDFIEFDEDEERRYLAEELDEDASDYEEQKEEFEKRLAIQKGLDENSILGIEVGSAIEKEFHPSMEFYEDVTTHTIGLIIKD